CALNFTLDYAPVTLLILAAAIALNAYLFIRVPKGFFPQQDTGRLNGSIQADQNTSFEQMDSLTRRFVNIVSEDPAVDSVVATIGGGRGGATNSSRGFISLKPLDERKATADQIVARLRPKLARAAGAAMFVNPTQDLRMGG